MTCLCTFCRLPLPKGYGDDVVQRPYFKMGELDEIALAHRTCAPEWAKWDDWDGEGVT
jgi:hypothetical protein